MPSNGIVQLDGDDERKLNDTDSKQAEELAERETTSSCANGDADERFRFSDISLETIRQMHGNFATERGWQKFHSPRNVLLALMGEIGEVAELFQWRNDAECEKGLPRWTAEQRAALGEELSDVLIYLVRLADRCNIDLSKAVVAKMAKNAQKYPVEKVYGSSKKYNEY